MPHYLASDFEIDTDTRTVTHKASGRKYSSGDEGYGNAALSSGRAIGCFRPYYPRSDECGL